MKPSWWREKTQTGTGKSVSNRLKRPPPKLAIEGGTHGCGKSVRKQFVDKSSVPIQVNGLGNFHCNRLGFTGTYARKSQQERFRRKPY